MSITRFTDFEISVLPIAALGEGPRWDAAMENLLWVDIPAKSVHRYDPVTGGDTAMLVSDVVSLALPRRRGGVIIGLPDGLHLLDGEQSMGPVGIESERADTRTNDGACDAAGRLWVGTMALDERSPVAGLYRVDPDLTVTTILTGTTISNGLGWSPSGGQFYFIDSPTRRVDVFDCDPSTGGLENRRRFVAVEVPGAVPDGLAVDAAGCVWVALHGGWGLNRYSSDGPQRPDSDHERERTTMKVIIVGGVAGGASCAARLRRLDESVEIVLVERGPYVSYANCGLPYFVGGVIEKEASLLLATPEVFRTMFAIDCRTGCEVVGVSAAEGIVELKDLATGEVTTENYDKLVLSPGAAPIRPPLPGIDLPGIFPVRTVPDAAAVREWVQSSLTELPGLDSYTGAQARRRQRRAVVVGGGFIGLEMAENLTELGLDVTVVQRGDQLMAPVDREMARYVERHLENHSVHILLNDGASGFEQAQDGSLEVLTISGHRLPADVVVLGIGVRPETKLAEMAGIELGERGGIRVDDQMHTSDPDIFAVGDAVEKFDYMTDEWSMLALAGPANRQGRVAADVIAGRDAHFRGVQGTAIVGLFGGALAWTGVSEKTLQRRGDEDYEKVYLFPNSHAGYYPDALPIAMKVVFRKSDGRLLGAQAVGRDGVDKRIDALAVAIQLGGTIHDLEEAELCYAPQFGSAKSPANFAGMVAGDVLAGDMPVTHWGDLDGEFLLDVRHPEEVDAEALPGVVNIPVDQLRGRLDELPRDRGIAVICRSGQRAYYATRILLQNGFDARVMSGGMLSHEIFSEV